MSVSVVDENPLAWRIAEWIEKNTTYGTSSTINTVTIVKNDEFKMDKLYGWHLSFWKKYRRRRILGCIYTSRWSVDKNKCATNKKLLLEVCGRDLGGEAKELATKIAEAFDVHVTVIFHDRISRAWERLKGDDLSTFYIQ